MAVHKVKCTICGEVFDTEINPFIKTSSNRYAHARCALEKGNKEQKAEAEVAIANQSQEEIDRRNLEDYIKELFSLDWINPRIRKQIQDFHELDRFTYSGILKTLKYFFEVKKGSIEKANNNIAIVRYYYDAAKKYYMQIWAAQQVNKAKLIEQIPLSNDVIIKIKIPKPNLRSRKTLFSFLDEEGQER